MLGGWIACPAHIMAVTGMSEAEYWAEPARVSIEAYRQLGMDGLIDVFVPARRDDFRCVDGHSYAHAVRTGSLEETLARIDALPSAAEYEEAFDFDADYVRVRAELSRMQAVCGNMVWMPAFWGAGAKASWFFDFGYEDFFCVIGLYPERAAKLMALGGAMGRCQSRLVARAVTEGLYPHAILLGEDVCTQRGPMIAPEFLEEHYAPALRQGLEPLLDAGCKPVWHCDGDVRPILDMLLDCGVQGLQGFQPECGMTIDSIVNRRTRSGDPLVIFGPLSVTTELPVCSPAEVRAKVRHAIDICRGRANLVLFTANTINPDVPLENLEAMYDEARRV